LTATLSAAGLAKSFGGRAAVDGLDLRVAPGEVVGLLGPNGAGKTTTFRLLLGLTRPDRGTVRLGERPLDGMPLHRRARLGLGYLPQGSSVFRGLTVRENLLAILEALGRPDPPGRAVALLERYGLTQLAERRAATLSGGERRRLEFARCLCSEPRILLADEPFAGVDPLAVATIAAAIDDLKRDGVGVLLTDHAVREALASCDRVCLIVEGRAVAAGTPSEIRDSDTARRLYLGADFS
jgi:lipopolysaccharide export system ATP-binding protein